MTDIVVPQPDPTLLTIAQLTREIANARELIESKVNGVATMLEGRIKNRALASDAVKWVHQCKVQTLYQGLQQW
jgi:hypothetical protein